MGGELIEPSYRQMEHSTALNKSFKRVRTTPDIRRSRLRRLIDSKEVCKNKWNHNALSGFNS